MGRRRGREGQGRGEHIWKEGHAQVQRHGQEGRHMQRRGHSLVTGHPWLLGLKEDAQHVSMGDAVVIHVRGSFHNFVVREEISGALLAIEELAVAANCGSDFGEQCPVEHWVPAATQEHRSGHREGKDRGRRQGHEAIANDAWRSQRRVLALNLILGELGAQRNLDALVTTTRALEQLDTTALAHDA